MAKEDFCFTYYDGDAARDKAHMNRLERGAYDDLISAQRKRGHLSLEDIKKVLSGDFEVCWTAMEWILKKDDDNKYYIEWVDRSIEKMRRQSENQKINASKRWNKSDATAMPPHKNGIDSAMPLENGDGDGNENGFEKENFEKSEKLLIPEMLGIWKKKKPQYPIDQHKDYRALGVIAKFICEQICKPYNPRDGDIADQILSSWESMADFVSKTDHINSYNLGQVAKYSQTIVQKIQNGKITKSIARNGTGLSGSAVIGPDKTYKRARGY